MGSVTLPGVRAMEMSVFTRLGGWQPSLHHNNKGAHVETEHQPPMLTFAQFQGAEMLHFHFQVRRKGSVGLAYPMPP